MSRQPFDEEPLTPAQQAAANQQAAAANVRLVDTGNDGNGGRLLPGTAPPDWGGSQYGQAGDTSSYDADVQRDRTMGAASMGRAPVSLDQTQANASRGMQMGALGLLRAQADGTAPSSAAILSQRANQNAATAAGSSGARTAGGAIVAAGRNGMQASNAALSSNVANADNRAHEIASGQNLYASGTQGVEGQDINAATTNAKLVAQQNALNEARQEGFERRGWNVRNSESQGEDRYARNVQGAENQNEANDLARQQRASDQAKATSGMIMQGVSSLVGTASDERAKTNIAPMGSLSSLLHRGRR